MLPTLFFRKNYDRPIKMAFIQDTDSTVDGDLDGPPVAVDVGRTVS